MIFKKQTHGKEKTGVKPTSMKSRGPAREQVHPSTLIRQAKNNAGSLSPGDILQLQRTIGNKAVGRLLAKSGSAKESLTYQAEPGKAETLDEALAGQTEPDQRRPSLEMRTQTIPVTATFSKGSSSPVIRRGHFTGDANAVVLRQRVAPTGAPTVHNGGGNSCVPGLETLSWDVVDAGTNWRANVTALNVSGNIHITAWTNNPNAMTVPNTPNPVDGGNINNTSGSNNYWQFVINDMADYDTSGSGGAGRYWHSTAASTAHEWAHWNDDYLRDAIPAANWNQANRDIDGYTVPKAGNANAVAARAALNPRVTTRFNTFVRAVSNHWNNVIAPKDNPGSGGRGYAAGMRVLNGHIRAVRNYAVSKGWRLSTAARAGVGAVGGALVGAGIGALVGGVVGAAVGAGVGGVIGGIAGALF